MFLDVHWSFPCHQDNNNLVANSPIWKYVHLDLNNGFERTSCSVNPIINTFIVKIWFTVGWLFFKSSLIATLLIILYETKFVNTVEQ